MKFLFQVGLLKTNGVGCAKAVYVYPTVSDLSFKQQQNRQDLSIRDK